MRLGILAIVIFLRLTSSFGWAVDASSAVEETLGQILPKTSSPEALSKNFQEPLLTDIPLTTIDGAKSGPARIACPGTKTIFQVLIQPSPTKDLQFVSVAYDTDYDGELDQNLDITVIVSGVCANGFVSCTPGTWQDCHWYAWKYEDGILSYEEVSPSSLGGCYCINSGCTEASFLTMKNQILRDLGGGIAGAMASGDPKLAVSEAEIEDLVIRYYGETSGDCSIPDSYTAFGSSSPESIFENQAQLDVLKEQELLEEKSDPESYYNLITTSSAFINANTQTCTVNRSVYFDGTTCQIVDQVSDGCKGLEEDPNCTLKEETVYDVNGNPITTYSHFNPTGVVPTDTCMILSGADFTSCVIENVGGTGDLPTQFLSCGDYCIDLVIGKLGDNYWPGSCTIYTVTHTLYIKAPKFIESATLRRAAWDDYMQIFINGNLAWCGPDHCTTLPPVGAPCERNTSWNWNLNQDLTSYFKTSGQLHIKVNVAVAGYGEGYAYIRIMVKNEKPIVCHDWWKIERTYICKDEPLPKPDISRADAVIESLTQNGSLWTYQDPAYGEGKIEFENVTGEKCIKACKLKIVEQRAQASAPYTTADYRKDPSSQFFIYRTCIDGTCPVKDGEEIVEDCKCLEEFGLAYGVLESLRQASIDMTCSDGIPKP